MLTPQPIHHTKDEICLKKIYMMKHVSQGGVIIYKYI